MKVLVCGGRDFTDREFVYANLELNCTGCTELIEGGAKGVDSLAGDWADTTGRKRSTFKARWDLYGKSAGFRRNRQMLEEGSPDLVISFPGGRGTANMVSLAKQAKVKVIEVCY